MRSIPVLLLAGVLAACGGTSASKPPANTSTAPARAHAACPAGQIHIDGRCERLCQTDADCYEQAPRCLEVPDAPERDTNPDGTMGAVLEPVRACGIDH